MADIDVDVQGVLQGSEKAIRHFVLSFTPIFRAIVLRMNLQDQDKEELVQDIWLSLVQSKFRPLSLYSPAQGASLKTFLSKFGYFRILDQLRKRKSSTGHLRLLPPEDLARLAQLDPYGSGLQESRDRFASLCKEMEKVLSAAELKFFTESFVEDRPVRELAESLNTTEEAIHTRRTRLRKQMVAIWNTLMLDKDEKKE